MGEEQDTQQVVHEGFVEIRNVVNNQLVDTSTEQPECFTSNTVVPDEPPSKVEISEEEVVDPIISKLNDIEISIRELRASDERYMVRTDIIDALNSTFEDTLEKSRVDNTFSTLTDVAIVREKYKKICKAVVEEKSTLSIDDVISSFVNFSIDLENILLRQNVTIFDDRGKKFDPLRNVLEKIEMMATTHGVY